MGSPSPNWERKCHNGIKVWQSRKLKACNWTNLVKIQKFGENLFAFTKRFTVEYIRSGSTTHRDTLWPFCQQSSTVFVWNRDVVLGLSLGPWLPVRTKLWSLFLALVLKAKSLALALKLKSFVLSLMCYYGGPDTIDWSSRRRKSHPYRDVVLGPWLSLRTKLWSFWPWHWGSSP